MSEINVVKIETKGLAEGVAKLIDAVSTCVGTVYEPTKIRRKAEAEAYALEVITKAEIQKNERLHRAARRLAIQEERRQENIDAVVERSMPLLQPGRAISQTPVDPDWMSRFIAGCQDVSHQELQELWSRILANEVAQPGACSRKTLTVLQDLSPDEAASFARVSSLVWTRPSKSAFIPRSQTVRVDLDKYGVGFGDMLQLDALGLIHFDSEVEARFVGDGEIVYHKRRHHWTLPAGIETGSCPVYPLTTSGVELCGVTGAEPHDEFYAESLQILAAVGKLVMSCPLP